MTEGLFLGLVVFDFFEFRIHGITIRRATICGSISALAIGTLCAGICRLSRLRRIKLLSQSCGGV